MSTVQDHIEKYRQVHNGSLHLLPAEGVDTNFKHIQRQYGDGSVFVKKIIPSINNFIRDRSEPISVLDYGCGKAFHVTKPDYKGWVKRAAYNFFAGHTVYTYFGSRLKEFYCYDPAVDQFSTKPAPGSTFDVVASADVFEHVPEEGIDDMLQEISSYLKNDGLGIFTISGIPAMWSFPDENGLPKENVHATLKPMEWWVDAVTRHMGDKAFILRYTSPDVARDDIHKLYTVVKNSSSYTYVYEKSSVIK